MKNLQKFLCFLALVVGFNSLSAQDEENSVTYVSRNIFGIDYLKFVFPQPERNICEAAIYLKSWDNADSEFVPLTTESCDGTPNDFCTIKLVDPQERYYSISHRNGIGFLVDAPAPEGLKEAFGYQHMYSSGENTFYIIEAGINTYMALTIPALDLDEQIFVFSSKDAGKAFSEAFTDLYMNQDKAIDFTVEPVLNLDDVFAKGKIWWNQDNNIVFDINYKGKSLSLVIDRSE